MRGIGGGGAMQSAYRRHTFTLSFAVLHYHHLVHPLFTVLSVIIDGDYSLCLPSLHTTQALRVRVQRGSVKGKYGNWSTLLLLLFELPFFSHRADIDHGRQVFCWAFCCCSLLLASSAVGRCPHTQCIWWRRVKVVKGKQAVTSFLLFFFLSALSTLDWAFRLWTPSASERFQGQPCWRLPCCCWWWWWSYFPTKIH